MEQVSFQLLPANIGAASSMAELDAEFKRLGLLTFSTDRVKDVHFQDYILPASLKHMGDVKTFLMKLDVYAKQKGRRGCEKATAARVYMAYTHHPDIPELRWSFRALADARRTPCACHEMDTYHPQ